MQGQDMYGLRTSYNGNKFVEGFQRKGPSSKKIVSNIPICAKDSIGLLTLKIPA